MNKDIVRRLYIYAAAFLGLQLLLAGARGVLGIVIASLITSSAVTSAQQVTASLSLSLALLICGLPLWAGHWWWAQRSVRAAAERRSALRRLYGYSVLLIAALSILFELQTLISVILSPSDGALWQPVIGALLINAAVWAYHWSVLRHDRPEVEGAGPAATVRCWYLFLVQAFSLGMAAYGAASLLDSLLQQVFAPAAGSTTAPASAIAALVAGLAVWGPHHVWWRRLSRSTTPLQGDEQQATLPQVYVAFVVTIAAIMALGGLTTVLYGILLAAFGESTWRAIIADRTPEVGAAVVGSVLWWYHRLQLLQTARRDSGARGETAARIIGYLTAAVGVGALFFGLGGLLGTLLRLLLRSPAAGSTVAALSADLALSLVAVPVYAMAAAQMERKAAASLDEEHTLARRIYLYAVLLFGIVTSITAVVVLVRLGLAAALGNADAGWAGEFARWLGYAVVGGAVAALYTTLVRRASRTRADGGAQHTIVIMADAGQRTALATAIGRELPGATLRLLAVDDGADLQTALAGTDILIMSMAAALAAPAVAAVHGFAGRRLLLASPMQGFEVVGIPSDEMLAREIVHLLEQPIQTIATVPATAAAIPGTS